MKLPALDHVTNEDLRRNGTTKKKKKADDNQEKVSENWWTLNEMRRVENLTLTRSKEKKISKENEENSKWPTWHVSENK